MNNDWPNIGKIVQFRIYYGDGKIVNGTTIDEWKQYPRENVQIMFLKDDKGDKFRNNGQDLYAWDPAMELRILARDTEIKRGKIIPDDVFHPLFNKAVESWDNF